MTKPFFSVTIKRANIILQNQGGTLSMKKFILFFLFIYSFTFSAELKTDKNLITGQLKNGLKYYIYPK